MRCHKNPKGERSLPNCVSPVSDGFVIYQATDTGANSAPVRRRSVKSRPHRDQATRS